MKTNQIFFSAVAVAIALTSLSSCSKDDNNSSLPPIGGYNSADEVGAADLVAYWPLNGSGVESKSSTAPTTTVGTTFVAGPKGQCANFASGYMSYPSIAALGTTTGSITISTWAKIANNGGEGSDGHPSVMFSLTRPDEWAGNINLMAETGWAAPTSDSLTVKGLAVIKNTDGGANWQDCRNTIKSNDADLADGHTPFANKNGGKWAQYVISWDATSGMFKVYANGVKISNVKWESRNGGSSLPLNFFTPTNPIIGALGNVATTTDTWNKPLVGQLDEIRVWKKALTAADINSLYELEKAGR